MRQLFRKTGMFLNKSVSLLLILMIVMTSMVSLVVTSVTAASTSTGASVSGEVFYLNTSSNTSWNPSGSNRLWALFANSSGAIINSSPVAFTSAGTNLYSATAPAGATSVEVILTDKGTFPAVVHPVGYERVYFDNTGANWSNPKIYCWSDSNQPDWDASPSMTKLGSSNYYFYDIDTTKYNKIIFHNGSGTQTDDLTLPSRDCSIYSWSAKSWNSVPYYLKSTVVSFTGRKAGANEIYVNNKDKGVLSKYPYGARRQNTSDWTTVYLSNENWTDAYVVFDYSDPYRETLKMTPVTGKPGLFSAIVPKYATVKFKPNSSNDNAASIESAVNATLSEPCFKMTNSTSYWCELSDSKGSFAHYSVGNTFGSGIYGVKATYYDYLSDTELTNGWRNGIQAGTGFNGSADDWFPFDNWNNVIKGVADRNGSWATPLYFGNFCNTSDGPYATSQHGARGGNGYTSEIGYLTRVNYGANNSNGLTYYNYSMRGLAGKTLNNGNITTPNGTLMPYFDNEAFKSSNAVKIIDSYFPFRTTDKGNGVTEYSFNSNGATDNVYFTWNNDAPTAVNYGAGTTYGVKDGMKYFMNGGTSGYGIFPFNTVADNDHSTGSSGGSLTFYYDVPSNYDRVIFRNKDNHGEQYPEFGKGALTVNNNYRYNVSDGSWSAYTGVQPSASVPSGYKRIFVTTSSGAWLSNTPDIYLYNSSSNAQYKSWDEQVLMTKFTASSSGGTKPLDYGFGIRLDIDFRVPKNGKFANGEEVKFKFEGDDDLWVYVTDSKGNSQLVLDMGGAHKMAKGEVNFSSMKSTVNLSTEANTSGDIRYNWGVNNMDQYVTNIGFEPNNGTTASTGTYNCLDPNETYHMTVFYMERGMLESNFKVSFTLTPATNDLRVNKKVNATNVNPGLEEAIENADFTFTPYQNGSAFTSATRAVNKEYTLNNILTEKYYLDANGSFNLTSGDTADFDKQFDTGSQMQIKETVSTNIKYDTEWEVINRKTGATIKDIYGNTAVGTGLNTNNFYLQDPTNKLSDAMLQVNYVNTPEVASVVLEKAVLDENNRDITSTTTDHFGFTVLVDLTGKGTDYKTYPLQYQLEYDGGTAVFNTKNDGYITFKPGEKVRLLNLPVGARYKVVEGITAGYAPVSATISSGGIDVDFTDANVTGTVVNGGSTVKFTNQLRPTNGVIEATKLLDGEAYTGKKFSFTLSGLPSMSYVENGETKETHDLSNAPATTIVDVKAGKVTFNADNSRALLRFDGADSVGKYRYKLVENAISDTDYTTDTSVYVVEIDVTSVGGVLTVSSPVYYYIPVKSATDFKPFINNVNKVSGATFKNNTKTGTINIVKEGTGDNGLVKLEGAEFTIYKSYVDGVLSDPLTATNGSPMVAVTDANGEAKFAGIPIFTDDSTEADVKYQTYYLAETKAVDGYQLLAEPIEFTLPMSYSAGATVNGQVQTEAGKTYSLTYTITNDAYKMPTTAGSGVNLIFVFGGAIMLTGVCGLLYSKKTKKAKACVRTRRYK